MNHPHKEKPVTHADPPVNLAYSESMQRAVRQWIEFLDDYPGWTAWKRRHIGQTLFFDGTPADERSNLVFEFSDEVAKKHKVIAEYLGLVQTVASLKECEFYFRRYPFRGLPVTRNSHITNVCEMYFARFYEFKERLKNYFKVLSEAAPSHGTDVGGFIRLYEREFDRELRARNDIHHRGRFEDPAIDQVFLIESMSTNDEKNRFWRQRNQSTYRRLANEWAMRVHKRGQQLDQFIEAIAKITLETCKFL